MSVGSDTWNSKSDNLPGASALVTGASALLLEGGDCEDESVGAMRAIECESEPLLKDPLEGWTSCDLEEKLLNKLLVTGCAASVGLSTDLKGEEALFKPDASAVPRILKEDSDWLVDGAANCGMLALFTLSFDESGKELTA